jgi:hypothetical protein
VRPMYSWKYGRIYYVFDNTIDKLPETLQTRIRRGMDAWEVATQGIVRFIAGRNPEFPPAAPSTIEQFPQTLVIKKGGSNSCEIGLSAMEGNKRQFTCELNIHDFAILHELGHAIGLLHEHERPDAHLFGVKLAADISLTVQKRTEGAYGVYSTEFDYDSIMLYTAGSSYDVPEFGASLRFMGKGMGNVTVPSRADIATVRHVYSGNHPPQPQPKRPTAAAEAPKREIVRIKTDPDVIEKLNQGKIHPRLERAIVDKTQKVFPKSATVNRKSSTEWEIIVKADNTKTYVVRYDKVHLIVLS